MNSLFLDLTRQSLTSSGAQPRSPAAAQLIASRIRKKHLTVRQSLFLVLEEPMSSVAARAVSLIVRSVTVLATVAATLDSVDWLTSETSHMPWVVIMYVCNSFFLFEACARVAVYIPFHRALLDPFIILDLLTVVPFIVRLASNGGLFTLNVLQTQNVLEGFASIRLLKLCRYYEGASLLARAFSRSLEQLFVPLFLLLLTVMTCSSVLFHVEFSSLTASCFALWESQGLSKSFLLAHPEGITWTCDVCTFSPANASSTSAAANAADSLCATCLGHPAGHPECYGVKLSQTYRSIPHAMWFTIVTVTTVGLGDVTPATWLGQCFISLVILLGVVFLAMPLSTVGQNFSTVWEERQLYRLQAVTRQLLAENSISPDDCLQAFKQFDPDGNGLIDANEFTFFIQQVLGLDLPRPEVSKLWRMLDINNTGAINFVEFTSVLFPKSEDQVANDLSAANVEGVNIAECVTAGLDPSTSGTLPRLALPCLSP